AVFYYLDIDPQDERTTEQWLKSAASRPRPGTVLLWDPIYSPRNAQAERVITLDELRAAGWVAMPDWDGRLAKLAANPSRRPSPDPESVLSTGQRWHVFRSPDAALPAERRERRPQERARRALRADG